MRKILPFFLVLILFSCSSDSSGDETVPEIPENAFELSLDLERSVFGIDEKVVINVSSDEILGVGCIESIFFRPDGRELKRCFGNISSDLGNRFQVSFSFQTVGTKTFIVEAQTPDAIKVSRVERQIQVDSITNTVRISRVTLISYPNKGLTFDPGFSDTDPERLADLYFQIEKRYVGISFVEDTPSYMAVDLPISEVHENESSFEWNFEGNEMLFSVDNVLYFKLFDLDGDPSTSEQFTDWFLNFGEYTGEKPSQITIDNYGGSVEVIFDLVWN